MSEQNGTQKKSPSALATLEGYSKSITEKIVDLQEQNLLHFPNNYSPINALKLAQSHILANDELLKLSGESLYNCMQQMVIAGLNMSKQQAYIVGFGGKAVLLVGYQGKMMMAKSINPNIEDIYAKVIRKGEVFEFEDRPNSRYVDITKHQRSLDSLDSTEYVGAYATIVYKDGRKPDTIIMTTKQIHQAWAKSRAKPFDEKGNLKPNSTHAQYPDDMMGKTVIAAICKPIINSSDDSTLFGSTVAEMTMQENQYIAEMEKEENANSGEIIDVEFEPVTIDEETGEVKSFIDDDE